MSVSKKSMIIYAGAVVALAAAGGAGFMLYKKYKKADPTPIKTAYARLKDIVIDGDDVHRLGDISIEDDEDVHRLGYGPRAMSSCKRGGCASMVGSPSFGF